MSRRSVEFPLIVADRRALTATIDEFVLVPPTRADTLASYTPGAHLPVRVAVDGSEWRVNAYSLTDDGHRPDAYRIAVRHRLGGGAAWLHEAVRPGHQLTVAPPRSSFAPVLAARHHLLLAAGVGVTPIVSHLKSAHRWGRSVEVIVGARDSDGPFAAEIDGLAEGRATRVRGRTALAMAVADALARQPVGTHAYACGPAGFLEMVASTASTLGWPGERVHVERFDAPELDAGAPFTALTSKGAVSVPSGVSLLHALDERGIELDRMCERGVCGQCVVGVRAGRILHRDLVLTDNERARGDRMMACVSRAADAELELDR